MFSGNLSLAQQSYCWSVWTIKCKYMIVHPFDMHDRQVYVLKGRKWLKCLIYEYFAEASLYKCPCVHQKIINQPWILLNGGLLQDSPAVDAGVSLRLRGKDGLLFQSELEDGLVKHLPGPSPGARGQKILCWAKYLFLFFGGGHGICWPSQFVNVLPQGGPFVGTPLGAICLKSRHTSISGPNLERTPSDWTELNWSKGIIW